jgi:hypothetical protein
MTFWKIVIASSLGQIIGWIFYQGFVQSYWGKQARESNGDIYDTIYLNEENED